jgi:hypothetical protein
LNNFTDCFKNILILWKGKIKNELVVEKLYTLTAKMFEYSQNQKDFNFIDKLTNDEKSSLMKFFFLTYDRFSSKKECIVKPSKIYSIHQSIIGKEGIGSLHRTLFTTQKKIYNLIKNGKLYKM